jgi:hypothetical protein
MGLCGSLVEPACRFGDARLKAINASRIIDLIQFQTPSDIAGRPMSHPDRRRTSNGGRSCVVSFARAAELGPAGP